MDQNYANSNVFFSDCKSSWRTWGPWGRCCTGNLELKKGEGLKYSDNPEAVQVRHRYYYWMNCNNDNNTFSGYARENLLVVGYIMHPPTKIPKIVAMTITVRYQRRRDAILVT